MNHRTRTPLIMILLALALGFAISLAPATPLVPDSQLRFDPELRGNVYDAVSFQTKDGVVLRGWFMPFQDQEGNAFRRPGPVIVVAPPDSGNMARRLWHHFTIFRGTPWHILLFDWRGYGESDPWEIEPGTVIVPEFVDDLAAAIDFVKTLREWDGENIGVFASDAGAAVTLALASQRDDLTCAVLRGIYTTQDELVAAATAADSGRVYRVNENYPAELEPLAVAPKVEMPVLLVVGEEDRITPPAMARRIYDALGGKRRIWVCEQAGHGSSHVPELVGFAVFTANAHAFYRRHLGTAGF